MKIINSNLIQKSFIFFLLLSILLALFLVFPYNQRKEVFADTACHERPIPVGLAMYLTLKSGNQILAELDNILKESENQISEAQTMIDLANKCHRIDEEYHIVRCTTGCYEWTTTYPIEWTCSIDGSVHNCLVSCHLACVGGSCEVTAERTEYHCKILPCSHDNVDACDFDEINRAQNQIEESFNEITRSLLEEIPKIIKYVSRTEREKETTPIIEKLLVIAYDNLRFCAGQPGIAELEKAPEEPQEIVCCYDPFWPPYYHWLFKHQCPSSPGCPRFVVDNYECDRRNRPKPELPEEIPELPTPIDKPMWFVLIHRIAEEAEIGEIYPKREFPCCFPVLRAPCVPTDFFCCVVYPPPH